MPEKLIRLLGADYDLMRKAETSVLLKFYLSSAIICLIAVLSFISIRYAMMLTFNNLFVECFLSIFVSLLFVLMYIFLLHTFTKDAQHRNWFSLSNVTRIGFIIFIGLMLSKPLEVFVFRGLLKNDVAGHREELKNEHAEMIDEMYAADLARLNKQKLELQNLSSKDSAFTTEINALDVRIQSQSEEKTKLINAAATKIDRGDYFLFQIRKLSSSYPLSWLLSLATVFIFLLPGFIIYFISKDESYFRMKNDLDRKIILTDWQQFNTLYSALFLGKEMNVHFFTKYEDAPFNTKLKTSPGYQSTEEFHKKYGKQ